MNSLKNKIVIASLFLLVLALIYFYKSAEVEKIPQAVSESQLEQQSKDALKATEAKVEIPTHHSEQQKKQ